MFFNSGGSNIEGALEQAPSGSPQKVHSYMLWKVYAWTIYSTSYLPKNQTDANPLHCCLLLQWQYEARLLFVHCPICTSDCVWPGKLAGSHFCFHSATFPSLLLLLLVQRRTSVYCCCLLPTTSSLAFTLGPVPWLVAAANCILMGLGLQTLVASGVGQAWVNFWSGKTWILVRHEPLACAPPDSPPHPGEPVEKAVAINFHLCGFQSHWFDGSWG